MAINTVVENHTPFSAESFVVPDKNGQELHILVVSAAFEEREGTFGLAGEQSPIRAADVYRGDPTSSSVRYESDVAPEKPLVDVLIEGAAYATPNRSAAEVVVQVEIGDLRKQLVVSGDRRWRHGPFGLTLSAPQPFTRMPLVYERAFGGFDQRDSNPARHTCDSRNPIGVGFNGARSQDPTIETEAPNIEYPSERVRSISDRPAPAGLGVVGRGWQPRIRFAGTYDEQWVQQRWPLLPEDFDARHYQAAPADQQMSRLKGGETVTLVNLTPDGLWRFTLPVLNVPVRRYFDDRQEQLLSLRFDTIFIEPDLRRVTLTSRVTTRTVRNQGAFREIVLGHMSQAWLWAHEQRKLYIDFGGRGGVRTDTPLFSL